MCWVIVKDGTGLAVGPFTTEADAYAWLRDTDHHPLAGGRPVVLVETDDPDDRVRPDGPDRGTSGLIGQPDY